MENKPNTNTNLIEASIESGKSANDTLETEPHKDDLQINPFARRESLQRTPPRCRTASLPNLDADALWKGQNREEILNSAKRKRVEHTPENLKRDTYVNKKSLKSTLEVIFSQVRKLEEVLKDAYKPKKEYCAIGTKLALQVEKLQTRAFREWLDDEHEEANKTTGNEAEMELRRENEQLRTIIQKMEADQRIHQTTYPDEKCEQCRKVHELSMRRRQLKKDETFESFKAVTEKDWQSGVFTVPQVLLGPITDAPAEWNIILPCNSGIESKYKGVNRGIKYFGGRHGLANQNRKEGEVAMMSHSLGFPDKDGHVNETNRWIYYPIISEGVINSDCKDSSLFQSLAAIKKHMISTGKNKIVIPEIEDVVGMVIIRMLTFLFADTPVQLGIYRYQVPEEERRNRMKTSKVTSPTEENAVKRPKKDTLRVQMKNKNFADLLKIVKTAL